MLNVSIFIIKVCFQVNAESELNWITFADKNKLITDAGWTVSKILERDGNGNWTGWSRKSDGKWSKSKDLLYCNTINV